MKKVLLFVFMLVVFTIGCGEEVKVGDDDIPINTQPTNSNDELTEPVNENDVEEADLISKKKEPFKVVNIFPLNLLTNPKDIPIEPIFTFTFNKSVDILTILNSIIVTDGASTLEGETEYNNLDYEVIFKPNNPLFYSTDYQIKIDTLKDLSSNAIDPPLSLSFRTIEFFIDNNDGTVTVLNTVWSKNDNTDLLQLRSPCNNLGLVDYDWKIPTKGQLDSLVQSNILKLTNQYITYSNLGLTDEYIDYSSTYYLASMTGRQGIPYYIVINMSSGVVVEENFSYTSLADDYPLKLRCVKK